MWYVFIFVFGLILGSFLNAVIYRLSVSASAFSGRSRCPHCKHVLHSIDLVPLVSFLFLRGQCRFCGKKISWQYPLIEATTASLLVLIFFRFNSQVAGIQNWFDVATVTLFTAYLIVIFTYDFLHYLILDKVVLPAIVIAFVLNTVRGVSWTSMVLGALVCGGFFALQYAVSRGRWIGGGDIRLGVLMGTMLAWPLSAVALFFAYISGAVVGLFLIMFGRKTLGSKIPFGTFLSVATYVTLLYGSDALNWYRNMTGL